MSPLRNVYLS